MTTLAGVERAAGADSPDNADALGLFLRKIRRCSLLSAAEEVQLAKQIEAGDPEAKARMVNAEAFGWWSRSRRDIPVEASLCST